jgi:hypothetical protein
VTLYADSSCRSTPLGTGTAEEFANPGILITVPPNTSTTLFATATDAAGNTSPCSEVGTTYVHDSLPPAFGGVSAAIPASGSQITLTWEPAQDQVTPLESTVYEICESTEPAAQGACNPFVVSRTTSPGATLWNVGGLTLDTSYVFGVRARDAAGNVSENPAVVTAKTAGIPGPDALAVGGMHTCALLPDRTARCWGWNIQGQLGSSDYVGGGAAGPAPGGLLDAVRSATPVRVTGLASAVAIAAGVYHSCALVANGTVKCWGSNGVGQFGDGSAGDFSLSPTAAAGLERAVALAAGGAHTCAVLQDGTARCWGWNWYGQVGDGSTANQLRPTAVKQIEGAVALAAGTWHTCALAADGTARCWGLNQSGQLGDGTTVSPAQPVPVKGLAGAIALRAGSEHTCALLVDGRVRCWGRNQEGQVGDGGNEARTEPAPVKDLRNVTGITAGDAHSCALLSDGSGRCWGQNDRGQLGNGGKEIVRAPVAVQGLADAVAIAAGGARFEEEVGAQTCAMLKDGTARCWGANDHGQLGDGTLEDRSLPVPVVSFP